MYRSCYGQTLHCTFAGCLWYVTKPLFGKELLCEQGGSVSGKVVDQVRGNLAKILGDESCKVSGRFWIRYDKVAWKRRVAVNVSNKTVFAVGGISRMLSLKLIH